jgi:hypothetical protein
MAELNPVTTRLHLPAVFKSGLISGVIFLLFPMGSPWSALSFGSGAVMGRTIAGNGTVQTFGKVVLQLALALVYALVIALIVKHFRSWRAIVVGGLVGLVLYGLNLAFVTLALPELRGMEARVVFTHFVFGLIAAACYKGMVRRPESAERPAS